MRIEHYLNMKIKIQMFIIITITKARTIDESYSAQTSHRTPKKTNAYGTMPNVSFLLHVLLKI